MRGSIIYALLATLSALFVPNPSAAVALDIGDPAPQFALTGSDGKVHRLSDYRGTAVVIAWFPKAFTGG